MILTKVIIINLLIFKLKYSTDIVNFSWMIIKIKIKEIIL